jgi:hypothetical protein
LNIFSQKGRGQIFREGETENYGSQKFEMAGLLKLSYI